MSRKILSHSIILSIVLSLIVPWGDVHSVKAPAEGVLIEEPKKVLSSREDYVEAVYMYAEMYNVSAERMINTINCENRSWNPTLQSGIINRYGQREESYGLSQIHLPSHPNISYEEAIDPEFSIEFMAKNFSEGKARLWTCYRNIYM